MIYLWFNPDMKYAGYLGVTDQDEKSIRWYDHILGEPLPSLSQWEPPVLQQYLGDGKKKRKPGIIGDAPSSGSINLISQRAVDVLEDILERHALLYPVKLVDAPDENFYMVVVKTKLDCLDRQKSTGFQLTGYGSTKYFTPVHTWVFGEKCLGDNDLFVIPDCNISIYVSERFKKRVIEAGLKGFGFKKEFWDENTIIT